MTASSGYQPVPPALPKDAYTSWLTRVAALLIDLIPVVVLGVLAQVSMSIAKQVSLRREPT
jgi:hypothetical protein